MKTALIIALIALIVGALVIGIGWVLLQKNPIDKNVFKDNVYPFGIDELPNQINVSTMNSRIEFRTTTENEWRVECMDKEKMYHEVELIDGVLTIKQIDARAWYEHIGIFTNQRPQTVIIYLPEGSYGTINIQSTSGDISVPEGFVFSDVTLKNTSGDISFASVVTGAMNIKVTSGDVAVNGSVGRTLEVSSVSGDIEIKNANPTRVTIKSTSGDTDLIDVVCSGACTIEKTSGSFDMERCDAASFNIVTTSGDIHGSILSAKTFDCKTTSGDIRTPADGNGGTFKAKTTSGDIKITIAE